MNNPDAEPISKSGFLMAAVKDDLTSGEYIFPYYTRMEFEANKSLISNNHMQYALDNGINKLQGDVLTLIEMLGLPETQEKAFKDQFKKAFGERKRDTCDELIKVSFALQEEDERQDLPVLG